MIAINEHERVVIEVRSQRSLHQPPKLTDLARAIEGRPGWRFEFIMTNPVEGTDENELTLAPLTAQKILERFAKTKRLADVGSHEAALLLAWSAAEGAMRFVADKEGIEVTEQNPVAVIKKLHSMGLLDRTDYELLMTEMPIRNAIAHGYDTEMSDPSSIDRIITVADRLLQEVGVSSK